MLASVKDVFAPWMKKMSIKNIYRATNESTGEVIEGLASYVADIVGVSPKRLYGYAERENTAKGWKIEFVETENFRSNITKTNWKEWDEFTEPIREYIRRRNAKRKQ